jgi:hypothetical protein
MHQFSVLVVLVAVGLATLAWAQAGDRFSMVGITADQTAQLNVVNTLTDPSELPCRVCLAFFDRQGNAVGTPADKSLAPGQAESVTVDKPKIAAGERFHLWALVRKVDTPDTGVNECRGMHSTLEVFHHKTRKTSVFLENPTRLQAAASTDDPGGEVTPDDLRPLVGRIVVVETTTGTFTGFIYIVTGTTSGTVVFVRSNETGLLFISNVSTDAILDFQPS